MSRKNPDNKPLRIVYDDKLSENKCVADDGYPLMLAQLALAQATLARHKDSALPHFIAIVKELERIYGFRFEQIDG